MKTLACSDLGAAECTFVASGETNEDVVQKMMEHAKAAHPEKMEQMKNMTPEEMNAMMVAKIKG